MQLSTADEQQLKRTLWVAAIKLPMYSVGVVPIVVSILLAFQTRNSCAQPHGMRCSEFHVSDLRAAVASRTDYTTQNLLSASLFSSPYPCPESGLAYAAQSDRGKEVILLHIKRHKQL